VEIAIDKFDDYIQWGRYLFRAVKIRSIANRELEKQNKLKDGIFPNEMYLLYLGAPEKVITSNQAKEYMA